MDRRNFHIGSFIIRICPFAVFSSLTPSSSFVRRKASLISNLLQKWISTINYFPFGGGFFGYFIPVRGMFLCCFITARGIFFISIGNFDFISSPKP